MDLVEFQIRQLDDIRYLVTETERLRVAAGNAQEEWARSDERLKFYLKSLRNQ